ncbi:hypothetical protein Fmac_011542 [Flemingia macrophylla]|uniref:Uncharacterized protein n=1 Tax=Flemingia macrophylla TaxID=520843 RepID=A0ABD1MN37_9FABA
MRTCPQDVGAICGKSEERVTAKPHPCRTDWAKRGGRVTGVTSPDRFLFYFVNSELIATPSYN